MIKIRNVSKTFHSKEQNVHAVTDVSLDIGAGEIYGIIGYSGAGKSTLVRLINRLEEADEGEIYIDGTEVYRLSPPKLRALRKQIGMIFQSFNLMPSRTVLGNILYPMRSSELSEREKVKRARELLNLCGLTDKENSYPAELSGGQKQRTGIARALANDPKILLCDEATSALDPETTKQILGLLKQLNRELGLTIVLITHEMSVVKAICDKVAIMDNGRVVECGAVYDLFTNPHMPVTRSFIESDSNLQKIDELITNGSSIVSLGAEDIVLKLSYRSDTADEALISQVSRRFGIDLSIIFGDIDVLQDRLLGGLIVIASGPRENLNQAVLYLIKQGIQVEVIQDAKHPQLA